MKMTFQYHLARRRREMIHLLPEWDGKGRDCGHSVFAGNVRHARKDAGEADEA